MSTVLWRPDLAAENAVTAVPLFEGSGTAAIVLAGSHAWNRSSIESVLPRPLLPVADKPLIAHSLRWLARSGAREATICSNGFTPLITEHLRHVPGLPFLSYKEDDVPRGPAGCAADALAGTTAERLLVVEGSTIPALNLNRLLREHQASGAAVTLVVQPSDAASAVRRPATPAGVYVFERSALGEVASGYQDIKEMLLQRLHGAGHTIRLHEAEGWCHQVVDTRTYLNVSQAAIRYLCGAAASAERPSACEGWPTQGIVAHPI
ncbi:MAG: sugar phosphate nucleotidyltransferase, partial [Acidobacteriota bacterium]